jgi:hypothetical protein
MVSFTLYERAPAESTAGQKKIVDEFCESDRTSTEMYVGMVDGIAKNAWVPIGVPQRAAKHF